MRRGLVICILLATTTSAGVAPERWRFVMTCDSRGPVEGINEIVLTELTTEFLSLNIDVAIFAGDLVNGTSADPVRFEEELWHWVRVMQPLYDAGVRVYVCRGNHEIADNWTAGPGQLPDPVDNYAIRWLNVFGSEDHPHLRLPGNGPAGETYMTYAVAHKNAFIVSTDQYAGLEHRLAHELDQRWLDAQLEANVKPHVFVFGHEPAFQALPRACLDLYPTKRDAFWRSLQTSGARVYFCGHDHFYDHTRIDDGDGDPDNDIHQFIVGTAGAYPYTYAPSYDGENGRFSIEQVYHAERYGYVLVDVDGLNVTTTWMERQDNDLDAPGVYRGRDVWRYHVSPGIAVLHPSAGERVSAGRPYTIRWKTFEGATLKRVFIEHSPDGGATWTFLAEADNTGAFTWLTPSIDSDASFIRISGVRQPTIRATAGPFSIFNCRTRLAADLNGDCYVDFADLAILVAEWLACGNPLDPACAR